MVARWGLDDLSTVSHPDVLDLPKPRHLDSLADPASLFCIRRSNEFMEARHEAKEIPPPHSYDRKRAGHESLVNATRRPSAWSRNELGTMLNRACSTPHQIVGTFQR